MPGVTLEDFANLSRPSVGAPAADLVARDQVEVEKVASYEQGYQAGWDDAARAEAADQTRIGAELARNLQDLSFTFHEARAHLIQAMEPLLTGLTDTFLPRLVAESLGARILEELQPMIEDCADSPVELVVAGSDHDALNRQMQAIGSPAFRLTVEPSLAPGQAYLRIGKTERQIDMAGATDRLSDAIAALYATNERILKHG